MRARSAPLDTLANSWSALESRAPSRAGAVSRGGSLPSRHGSRRAASRGSTEGRHAHTDGRGDVRTAEIQRLQGAIRDIKTA
jgi:hypothetical protein